MEEINIRKYMTQDREAVRKISYQTAFLELSHEFVDDEEILADILTYYFTEYEPQSCFVACFGQKVIGYLVGTQDVRRMNRKFISVILPHLFLKALNRGTFFRVKTLKFLFYCMVSYVRGEFAMPDVTLHYPATFHINLDQDYRGKRIGEQLTQVFSQYLQAQRIPAVFVGTMSEKAKEFFEHNGFQVLYKTKRSYLRYFIGKDTAYFLLGKKISA